VSINNGAQQMTDHSGNWEGINPSKKSGMLKRYGLGPSTQQDQHCQDRNFHKTFGVSVNETAGLNRDNGTMPFPTMHGFAW
jgi:hypothetical protein